MRFHQLLEADSNGTFIGIRLTSESANRILAWLEENNVKDPTPFKELHVTLLVDKTNTLDHDPIRYDPPLVPKQDTYKVELFGKDQNILVLTFDCPQLTKRHDQVKKRFNVVEDWDEYRPHITLTYTVQEVTGPLEPPDFPIELSHEYVMRFDPSWA